MLASTALAFVLVSGDSGEPRSAAAAEPAVSELHGAIAADGTVVDVAPSWEATRRGAGSYELRFVDDVRLDVTAWDAAATVTLRPTAPATWRIDLLADGAPVDAAFAFRAVAVTP